MNILTKALGFDSAKASVRTEVVAGATTFLTMSYILAVNPAILATTGMDKGALFTATALAAAISTLLLAFMAKLPFAQAPSMGLNAFFAFTMCQAMHLSWQQSLAALFVEGVVFILITFMNVREKILDSIPRNLRYSISAGIGMFIAFIGLKNAGIVSASPATFVTMGNLHDPAVLLAAFGILLSAVLLIKKVTGALLIGILVTTVIGIPLGVTHFTSVLDVPPSIAPVVMKFEWNNVLSIDMAICVLTFLFIDMFDTIGTLLGVSHRAGMVDEKGNIPHLTEAFMADAIGTAAGAMLGTSTVTTYVESASGVNAGGRSGLTSFTTAICFVLALFLAPLFLAIPAQATAPALVLVGVMMMTDVSKLHLGDFADAVPAFVCIALMPLTYSISDGILMGLITYVLLRIFAGRYRELKLGMIVLAVLFVLKYAFL